MPMSDFPIYESSASVVAEGSDDDNSSLIDLVGNIESFLQNLKSSEEAFPSKTQSTYVSNKPFISSPEGANCITQYAPQKEMIEEQIKNSLQMIEKKGGYSMKQDDAACIEQQLSFQSEKSFSVASGNPNSEWKTCSAAYSDKERLFPISSRCSAYDNTGVDMAMQSKPCHIKQNRSHPKNVHLINAKIKPRSPNFASFPYMLYLLLEEASSRGIENIVSWQQNGRAFRVHNQHASVCFVMPQYFQQTRFSSFQRQLALYGFNRVHRKGNDQGSYSHERFIRGYPQLCDTVVRTPIKGTRATRQTPTAIIGRDCCEVTQATGHPLDSSLNISSLNAPREGPICHNQQQNQDFGHCNRRSAYEQNHPTVEYRSLEVDNHCLASQCPHTGSGQLMIVSSKFHPAPANHKIGQDSTKIFHDGSSRLISVQDDLKIYERDEAGIDIDAWSIQKNGDRSSKDTEILSCGNEDDREQGYNLAMFLSDVDLD